MLRFVYASCWAVQVPVAPLRKDLRVSWFCWLPPFSSVSNSQVKHVCQDQRLIYCTILACTKVYGHNYPDNACSVQSWTHYLIRGHGALHSYGYDKFLLGVILLSVSGFHFIIKFPTMVVLISFWFSCSAATSCRYNVIVGLEVVWYKAHTHNKCLTVSPNHYLPDSALLHVTMIACCLYILQGVVQVTNHHYLQRCSCNRNFCTL